MVPQPSEDPNGRWLAFPEGSGEADGQPSDVPEGWGTQTVARPAFPKARGSQNASRLPSSKAQTPRSSRDSPRSCPTTADGGRWSQLASPVLCNTDAAVARRFRSRYRARSRNPQPEGCRRFEPQRNRSGSSCASGADSCARPGHRIFSQRAGFRHWHLPGSICPT